MGKTCLNRLLGYCPGCKEDYEPITFSHPVNNYNCNRYNEVFAITDEEKRNKNSKENLEEIFQE